MSDYSVSKNVYPGWVADQYGLTDEEVTARQAAGKIMVEPEGPTISDLVRKYVLTIFNLGLFSLIVLQLLFQKPWDALISALLMFVGFSINVGHELWARRRLANIAVERKETVTVIRNGIVKAIDLQQMVIDDVVFAGREDLITADRVIIDAEGFIVDEIVFLGEDINSLAKGSVAYLEQRLGHEGLQRLSKNTGYTFEYFSIQFTLDHFFASAVEEFEAGVWRDTDASDH